MNKVLDIAENVTKPILYGVRWDPFDWHIKDQLALLRKGDLVTYCFHIGPGGLAPKGKDLELHKLYIKKNQRGKGLAKIMVIKAEKYAKKFGFKKMILWTDTRFKEAHLMYLKLNYKKMKKTRRLYDISDTTEFHFQKKIF